MNVYPLRSESFQSSGDQHSAWLSRLHFLLRVHRIFFEQKFKKSLFWNLTWDFERENPTLGKRFSSRLSMLNSTCPKDHLKNKKIWKRSEYFAVGWTKQFRISANVSCRVVKTEVNSSVQKITCVNENVFSKHFGSHLLILRDTLLVFWQENVSAYLFAFSRSAGRFEESCLF